MKINWKGIFLQSLAIGFAFIIIIIPVFGEEEKSYVSVITKNDLQLILETNRSEYVEGEIVNIRWNVTNINSDVIKYRTLNTCHDGWNFSISNSERNRITLLSASALLIPENDPLLRKFDDISFYGKILNLTKTDPNREVIVTIITGDNDGLEDVLRKNHGVTKIGKGEFLSFVNAKVQAKEIPKIAEYNFVRSISDAGGIVCGAAEGVDFLTPGESIERNFSWSQLVPSANKWKAPHRVPEGYYLIKTEFHGIVNCLVIELKGDGSISRESDIPCGQNKIPPLDQDIETVLSTILPQWIKNNAKWWADGQIDDESFVNGLQYMINEKIIHVPKFDVKKDTTDKSLPPWIKNNAKWWAEGFISQREFITGIQYMVEHGIIQFS